MIRISAVIEFPDVDLTADQVGNFLRHCSVDDVDLDMIDGWTRGEKEAACEWAAKGVLEGELPPTPAHVQAMFRRMDGRGAA